MTRDVRRARSPAAVQIAVGDALERDRDLHRFLLALATPVVEARGATYLTGGYLRDIAAGKPGGDVDLMVAGLSHGMLEEELNGLPADRLGIRKIVHAGKHFPVFRMATAWSSDYVDISLARGHGAAQGWAPFVCAVADAARRDFTINAMLYELVPHGNRLDGELIDPFGGIRDMARGLIRCVGSARDRIREDPLRALRAIRLKNEWKGFSIDPATFRAIRQLGAALLPAVPADRLIAELLRSLEANPRATMADLRRAGIVRLLLPELSRRKAGAARAERRYEYLERSLRGTIPASILLSNLLIDLSAPDAETAARRLRFPNVRHLLPIVSGIHLLRKPEGMRFPFAETEAILGRQEDTGPFIALYLAAAACDGTRGTNLKRFLNLCVKVPSLITGSDLKKMGYPEGPEREETLLAVRDAALRGTIRSRETALAWANGGLRARDGIQTGPSRRNGY